MSKPRPRPDLVLVLLCTLAAPGALAQQDPEVDSPPPLSAICPAIEASYQLCVVDSMSPDCEQLVQAADALGRLYLFNVEVEPQRKEEFTSTVWWGCGSKTLSELKGALETLQSADARALLAQQPWRDLPARAVRKAAPAARRPVAAAATLPDCTALSDPAEVQACQQRSLEAAEAAYQKELARCEAVLTPFMRQQLATGEAAWQRDRGVECAPGDGQTACLAAATRQRTASIALANPQCASAPVPSVADAREAEKSGQRTGLLPARWTPPHAKAGAGQEVTFSFESFGGNEGRGRMETTLGDGGERFVGDYLRIQKSTKGDLVTAMSVGWSGPEWQLWKSNGDGGWIQEGVSVGEFADFYTGKVLATLDGDRGHAMRCQFELKDAEEGFLEGGRGRCQVTDGGTLALQF